MRNTFLPANKDEAS